METQFQFSDVACSYQFPLSVIQTCIAIAVDMYATISQKFSEDVEHLDAITQNKQVKCHIHVFYIMHTVTAHKLSSI